ncbi:hypothetical protein FNV43_RR15103 [Rhamnella rubrinervis]|uniref:Dirigent protein n=1 Tax=Rhamnella rubrinervis TaxID=2594499 RepID=A0A8K0GWX8_9ROSA|nr:hypothetical protein FNV43_RR15103 [Rhamnella rubrinervis]
MANTLPNLIPFFFFLTILFISTFTAATTHSFSRPLSPKKLGLKRLKLTHLHFYFHDIVGGKNPTAIIVAGPKTTNTTTLFGNLALMDELLTVGSEPTSKLVGKAQGIYAGASQSEMSTGVFRFASGYVQARAPSAYLKTKYAVEFNVYAFHY